MLSCWRTLGSAWALLGALAVPAAGQEVGVAHACGGIVRSGERFVPVCGAWIETTSFRGKPTWKVRPLLERTLGAANVKLVEPSMAGEDFAYFANEVPGFFFRLGVVKPGTASGGLHTPTFRADDSAVPAGTRVMARLLADYLLESAK